LIKQHANEGLVFDNNMSNIVCCAQYLSLCLLKNLIKIIFLPFVA